MLQMGVMCLPYRHDRYLWWTQPEQETALPPDSSMHSQAEAVSAIARRQAYRLRQSACSILEAYKSHTLLKLSIGACRIYVIQ